MGLAGRASVDAFAGEIATVAHAHRGWLIGWLSGEEVRSEVRRAVAGSEWVQRKPYMLGVWEKGNWR